LFIITDEGLPHQQFFCRTPERQIPTPVYIEEDQLHIGIESAESIQINYNLAQNIRRQKEEPSTPMYIEDGVYLPSVHTNIEGEESFRIKWEDDTATIAESGMVSNERYTFIVYLLSSTMI
jgi:hypothetical protein